MSRGGRGGAPRKREHNTQKLNPLYGICRMQWRVMRATARRAASSRGAAEAQGPMRWGDGARRGGASTEGSRARAQGIKLCQAVQWRGRGEMGAQSRRRGRRRERQHHLTSRARLWMRAAHRPPSPAHRSGARRAERRPTRTEDRQCVARTAEGDGARRRRARRRHTAASAEATARGGIALRGGSREG